MSKIKRKPIVPTDEPPELPKRNTLGHSMSYSSSISSDMDIRPSLPIRSSTYSKTSPSKPEDVKRLNTFLYTPKRLFPGDHIRTNTITQFDANPQVEDLLINSTGLKRSSTLKDLRRHVRDRTKNPDDAASVDSSKSTREDTANKIKSAFNELEILKRKNDELEKKLAKYEIKPEHKESNISHIWSEIEELTNSMMKELKLSEDKVLRADEPKSEDIAQKSQEQYLVEDQVSPKAETEKIEQAVKKQAWDRPVKSAKVQDSTETLDVQDPDLSSQFHSDMLKMMSNFVSETPGPTAYSVDQSSIVNSDPNKHFGFLEKKERFKELIKEQANPEDTDYASETSEIKPTVRKVSGGESELLAKFKTKMIKLEEQFERKFQTKEKELSQLQNKLNKIEVQYRTVVEEKSQFQSAALVKDKQLMEVNRKLTLLQSKLDKEEKIFTHFNEKVAKTDVLQRKVEELEKLQGKQKLLADRKFLQENESLCNDLQKYKSKLELLESEKYKLDLSVSQLQQEKSSLKSKLSALQTTYENAKESWKTTEDKFKEEYREMKKRVVSETDKRDSMQKEFSEALLVEQKKLRDVEKRVEALKTSNEAQKNAYLARIQNLETDLDITERALSTKEDHLSAMAEELEVLKQTITKRKFEYENQINLLKNLVAEKDRDLESQSQQIAERLKKIQTEKLELEAQKENDADKFEKTILSLQSTIQQYQAEQNSSKKDYQFQIKNYEQQIANLKQEITANNQELQLQSDNATKLRVELLKYEKMIKEHQRSSESTVNELKSQLVTLHEEYKQLSNNKSTENEIHSKELFTLRSEIDRISNDFEAKTAVMEQDNRELTEKCSLLEKEHQSLKNEYEHELFVVEEKLALKNTHLEEMNSKYENLIDENSVMCQNFEKQVSNLKQTIDNLLAELKGKEQDLAESNRVAQSEMENLNHTISQMKKASQQTQEHANLELDECRKEIEKLRIENESLNQKCVSKDEALAISCKDREAERAKMQKNCDSLVEKIRSRDDIISGRDQKISELTSEISTLKQSRQLTEINHKKALEESERLLKEKDGYAQSLFKKIERLEKELQDEKSSQDDKDVKMAMLRKELSISQGEVKELSEQNSLLETKVAKLEHSVEDQRDRLLQLESICASLESSKEIEHRNYMTAVQQLKQMEISQQDLTAQLLDCQDAFEKTKESLLVAKAKLKESSEENSELVSKVENLDSSLSKTEKELNDCKTTLQETIEELNSTSESKKVAQKSLHETQRELEDAFSANEYANNEISQLKQKEKKLEAKLSALENQVLSEGEMMQSTKKELELTKTELSGKSESVDRLNTQLGQMKQELSKFKESYHKNMEQLQDANTCIARNSDEITNLKVQLQKESQRKQELKDRLESSEASLQDHIVKLSKYESELKDLKHRNLELLGSLADRTEELKNCQGTLQSEVSEKNLCLSKSRRLDEQCKQLQTRVAELEDRNRSLNADCSNLSSELQSSVESKQREIQRLENKLMAVEQQSEEVQKSYSDLLKQHNHEKFKSENLINELQELVKSRDSKLKGCEEKIEALTELSNLRTQEQEQLSAAHELTIKKLNDKFHSEKEDIQKKYAAQLHNQKLEYFKEKSDLEEKLKLLENQRYQIEEKLEDYTSKLNNLSLEFNEMTEVKNNSDLEIAQLTAQVQSIAAEKATVERELVHVKDLYSEYRNKVEKIEHDSQKQLREVQELRAKLSHESELKAMAQNDYTELRETFKVKFNDLHELNKTLEKEKVMLSKKFDADLQKLSERLAEKTTEMQQLEMQLGTATGANERFELKLSNEISSREMKIKQMEGKLTEKLKENEKLAASIANLMKEKEAIQNNMNSDLKKEVEKHAETLKRRADAEKHELGLVIEELKAAETSKNAEIARLNSQLLTTMNDLETLKDSHKNQLEKFKQLGKLTAQEIQQVASEKASLYGHTNVNQKIKHLQKISEENLKLKAEKIQLERDRDLYRRRALNLEREIEAQRSLGPNEKTISRVARNFKTRPPLKEEEIAVVEEKENVLTQLGAASGGVSFMIE
ncbi:hypothetical protein HDV06_000168 [Boothiomyces sp. JEL0866]|nr:hypothetical protein HDV06_000168 [Boothiomyces sp. JEL0866]